MEEYIMTEITGKLFNKLNGKKKLFKILNNNLCHYGFKYKEGYNIDTVMFNPSYECQPGGLYFCEERFLFDFINYGTKIATVEILDDARVYVENRKFKVNKIILSNIILLKDFDKFTDPVFCKLAVQKHGLALQYVLEQTKELCTIAIQQNSLALQYVLKQTEELCTLARQRKAVEVFRQYAEDYEMYAYDRM